MYTIGSLADISGSRADKGSDMTFFRMLGTRRTFPEIEELYCDSDYEEGYDMFGNSVIYVLHQPAKVISGGMSNAFH